MFFGPDINVFHVLADVFHTASKIILIWAIHNNRSAEGVSLLTQLLYILVFVTRYLDLITVEPWLSWWNFTLKLFYITSSLYIVFVMMRVFARTREKEGSWKLAFWTLAGSAVSAPIVCLIIKHWEGTTPMEVLWTFSIELESVCVLPQLLLLRQTSVPTVIDSYYLVALGSYRALYIMSWIYEGAKHIDVDATSVVFGVVQTLLYIDFAWVYYSRQRVKLRGGGVVDADDLSKGFLVPRLIGGKRGQNADDDSADEDDAGLSRQENGTIRPSGPKATRSWGRRGISVSADETLPDDQMEGASEIADPSHFEDDDDDDAPPPPKKDGRFKSTEAHSGVGSSASEWSRDH